MKTKDKTLFYGLVIALSVLDIVAVLGFGTHLLTTMSKTQAGSAFNATYNPIMTIVPFVEGAIVVIGIITFPFLTAWRQKLRDEVEYDEDGVSRKHGKFSQLSKEERKQIDLQNTMDRERILSANAIKTIKKNVYDDPDKELERLIGLRSVKAEIAKMKARMEYELNEEREKGHKKVKKIHLTSNSHMMFLGNPGTGKTATSRIIASYLYKYRYIEKPFYFEIDGNFFNGLTMGESSKKVAYLCKEAKGSCIYIDEAYALCSTRGQEVIASLVKQMEDNADNIVFIFSGYGKEMQEFIDSNSGITSRIKYWFRFEDYNDVELQEIFTLMAREHNFVPDYELVNEVATHIGIKRKQPNFGNARDVRNELDRIIDNHAFNLAQGKCTEDNRYRLTLADY